MSKIVVYRNIFAFIFLSILMLAKGSCGGLSAETVGDDGAINTTVCDLAVNPQRYADKLVRVHAQYDSDGIDHELLSDSTCPDIGIVPAWHPSSVVGKPLLDVLRQKCIGTRDKQITAIWQGRYHWEPKTTIESGVFPRWIDITKIEGLEVKLLPGFPSCRGE